MKYSAQIKNFVKIGLPAILLSFAILIVSRIVLAQEATSTRIITISPPTIEHILNPGESAEGILKITNGGDAPLTFAAGVRDFIVEDKAGTPVILADDTLSKKYSAASWIAVTPSVITVLPKETKSLNYYLQVPLNASPGGRFAAAIYEPTNIIDVEGTGAGVNTQLGSLFYITVEGPVTESGEVVSFSAPFFNEYPPVTVTSEIANNSDIHIKPSGSIVVKNLFGQEVGRQEFGGKNIFPEANLIYQNSFFKDQKFKIGRYTAELSAIYGKNNNLPLSATVSFIIFPWKAATATTLIVAIVIVAFLLFRRRKNRKEETQTNSI